MPLRLSRYLLGSCTLSVRGTSVPPENACASRSAAYCRNATNDLDFYRYNEAMATIRRVPSVEHNFQLVITRVYEEGDQELLEDEDESEHPCSKMSFRSSYTHSHP
jgi:hypothetical protein